MVHRRRPTISRLALRVALAILSWPTLAGAQDSAIGSLQAELKPAQNELRFAMSEGFYLAGIKSDFRNLSLLDNQGLPLDFAVCAQQSRSPYSQEVPIHAVPPGQRPELGPDQSIGFSAPPGLISRSTSTDWIVDLRELPGPAEKLQLPASNDILHIQRSADLRSWGPKLSFQQSGPNIQLDTPQQFFLRLRLAEAAAPGTSRMRATGLHEHPERSLHWFKPQTQGDNLWVRGQLPIRAARWNSPDAPKRMTLSSRQDPKDAWKPREDFRPDHKLLHFSAQSDRYWQLHPQAADTAALELGHDAFEIRVRAEHPINGLSFSVFAANTSQYGPTLSCLETQTMPPSSLVPKFEWQAHSSTEQSAKNLRWAFLLLASVVLLGLIFGRRLTKQREAR